MKRLVKNKLGLKAPRGWGWVTNPKKAADNRVYNGTTRGCLVVVVFGALAVLAAGVAMATVLVR